MPDVVKPIEPVYALLGLKVAYLRTGRGWTQAELAAAIGLSRTSVVNIEAGRQRILLHDVEKLAAVFRMTPRNFLRGIWE